ncbi:hypothetical protein FB472_1956 [Rhodoglobus vestalii]|uniref:Uncharacterized protein n=1 Tax=Rhodoglobus vestalii TaxID=193384 RepID=A0A8H2K547_9MICO|nr:hypothetical protein [Rhodoglobus vestalii]TQO20325.1 hypothetical protein FB472_1956 [Rhodoglobus vestalii]
MGKQRNMNEEIAARVLEAHRASFALVTDALTNDDADPRSALGELNDHALLLDIAAALVWHAAGALVTLGETREGALEYVRRAALLQEQNADGNE